MKRQVFFHIAEFWNGFCFNLFLRKRLLHFLCYLFIQEKVQVRISGAAVCKCSSKQVFLKITRCSQKTPVFESLFNKAGAQHRCFPVNIAKFLRTVFLWNTFCSSHFYVMIEFFGRSGYKIEVFHVSCTIALFSFIILVLESELDSYFVLVFIPKFLVNAPFARITTSAPALF